MPKNDRPLTVLHLLSSLQFDESERGVYHIAHALRQQGDACIVVACADRDHDLAARLERDGCLYRRLCMPKKSWLSLRCAPALARLIDKTRPDVVHVHSRTPAWVLHWALRFCKHRPKIVAAVYGFYHFTAYSKILLKADAIVAASKSVDRYLKKTLENAAHKIVCIRRGVDTRAYPYRYTPSVHWLQCVFSEFEELERKKWLVFPNAVDTGQGQEWLIDIIGNLKDKRPDLHIVVMDDDNGDDMSAARRCVYDDFRQRLGALNLQNYVSFVGRRPCDLKDWLAAAHAVLALADRPESIGINALKAIHLGAPVIGWDKGAFGDILADLYPRGLVKEQNAKTLCKAVDQQLNTGVRPSIARGHDIESMVAQTLALYRSLTKPNP